MEMTFQFWNKYLNFRKNKTAMRMLTCVNTWSFNEYILLFIHTCKLILWWNSSSRVGASCINIMVPELLQAKSLHCLLKCEDVFISQSCEKPWNEFFQCSHRKYPAIFLKSSLLLRFFQDFQYDIHSKVFFSKSLAGNSLDYQKNYFFSDELAACHFSF